MVGGCPVLGRTALSYRPGPRVTLASGGLQWPCSALRACASHHARPSGPRKSRPTRPLLPPRPRRPRELLGRYGLAAIAVLGPPGLRLSRGPACGPRTPAARTAGAFFLGGPHWRPPIPPSLVFFIVFCSAKFCNFEVISQHRRIKKHKYS